MSPALLYRQICLDRAHGMQGFGLPAKRQWFKDVLQLMLETGLLPRHGRICGTSKGR
jgi:hypothetical protein